MRVDVTNIRTLLGLSRKEFVELLGVSPSTLHRWEQRPDPRIDPAQMQILFAVSLHLQRNPPEEGAQLGNAIREGLLLHGMLGGLHRLLRAIYGPHGPRLANTPVS